MIAQARGEAPSPRPSPRARGEGAEALRLSARAFIHCQMTASDVAVFSILAINAEKDQ
jgi:hypothetical protein